MGHPGKGPRLRVGLDEFDNRTTQAFRRPGFGAARERISPNRLFRRVAELLHCAPDDACKHLARAMTRAEATPQAFTRADLVSISPAILEVIETAVPVESRQSARDQLRALLQDDPA